MSAWDWVWTIILGGIGIPTGVFLTARALVYRQTDPARGEAYLAWFREEKAREQHAGVRPQTAAPRRPVAALTAKPPARTLYALPPKEPANR